MKSVVGNIFVAMIAVALILTFSAAMAAWVRVVYRVVEGWLL